jgi:transposase
MNAALKLPNKYGKILDRIKGEPEYKRKVAENRFLLIKDYTVHFERGERRRVGEAFRQYKSLQKYCTLHNISPTAFKSWLQSYESGGIRALLPKYGNRKGCSPYTSILPLVVQVIEPGGTVAATYRKLFPVCEQHGIIPPSQKTLGRMLKANDLSCTKGQPKKVKIRTSLDIDLYHPLDCLEQIKAFIDNNEAIPLDIKDASLRQLNAFLIIFSRKKPLSLHSPLTDEEITELKRYKAGLHKNHSAKATALLMMNEMAPFAEVVMATGRHPGTIYEWVRKFKEERLGFVKVKLNHPERSKRLEERKTRIIDILHTPPNSYQINRASWNYDSIARVYSEKYGEEISKKTVERAVKQSGYTWRHARKVLTSPDPEYRVKIAKVLEALRGLKENEAFFFIDECGPYRVKKYGGIALAPKDATRTIPERQKSKGSVQFIAALEAVTNQITWRFIDSKATESIVSLIEDLCRKYSSYSKIILTWDAISSHGSQNLMTWMDQHNKNAELGVGPSVEIVPLPSRAQFLNVIEAVFGGMKKVVIKNSDYPSKQKMEEAISSYFEERNKHFQTNPKRAGNKIWDKEAFDFDKLPGGLFRRM